MFRDDAWQQSCMFICLGAAGVIFTVSWRFSAPVVADSQGFVMQPPGVGGSEPASSSGAARPALKPAMLVRKGFVATPQVPVHRSDVAVQLVVDLSDRRLMVHRANQPVITFPLGVGQPGWETPTGQFQVMAMQQYPRWKHPITGEIIGQSPQNPLGTRWIGFWTDGKHHIGFHGTNQQQSIGQAVSHGCLRMSNRQIEQLYEWVKVGTPVVVRP